MNERTQAEATETVVSEVAENGSPEERKPTPREEIARKFVENHRTPPEAEPEEEPEAPPEEEDQELPPAAQGEEEPKEELVRLRVDGELKEVPASEAIEVTINGRKRMALKEKVEAAGGIEVYQKDRAADERLKEAAEHRRVIAQEVQALEAQKKALAEKEKALAEQGEKEEKDDRKIIIEKAAREYHAAVFNGDEDKAQEKLQALMATMEPPKAPGPQPEEVISQAQTAAVQAARQEQYAQTVMDARAKFADEYPDIVTDRILFNATDQETAVIMREHPDWTPYQVLVAAGDEIRAKFKPQGEDSTPAEGGGSTQESKVAEKRGKKHIRAGTGRSPAKPAPKQQTRSQYVESLQKRRGQI